MQRKRHYFSIKHAVKVIEQVRKNAKRKIPPTPVTGYRMYMRSSSRRPNSSRFRVDLALICAEQNSQGSAQVVFSQVSPRRSRGLTRRGPIRRRSKVPHTFQVLLSVLGVDTGSDLSCAVASIADPTELLLLNAASSFLNCSISWSLDSISLSFSDTSCFNCLI